MEKDTENRNSKSTKNFVKSLPVIIALFAIFSCGFAAIVLQHYGNGIKTISFDYNSPKEPILTDDTPFDEGSFKIITQSGNDSIKITRHSREDSLKMALHSGDSDSETNLFIFGLLCFLALLPLIGPICIPFGLMLLPSNSKDIEHIRSWLMDTTTAFITKGTKKEKFMNAIFASMRNTKKWTYQNLTKEMIQNLPDEILEQSSETDSTKK